LVYHHHTRRKGGHIAELLYWTERLRSLGFDRVDALRAAPYSPRAFFLLNADDQTRDRAAALANRWDGLISWHPDSVLCLGDGRDHSPHRFESESSE
jgi:hypothetical protein